jgi:hypothetical protein
LSILLPDTTYRDLTKPSFLIFKYETITSSAIRQFQEGGMTDEFSEKMELELLETAGSLKQMGGSAYYPYEERSRSWRKVK